MHQPVRERLEDYLSGMADPGNVVEFEEHLAACDDCRRMVERMRKQAELVRVLRAPAEAEPGPGFYARVMDQIETQSKASVWNGFLEPVFARRLVYASLTLLLLLGGVMASVEPQEPLSASSPEVILAEDAPTPDFGVDQQRDREVVLVNLATYQDY